MKSRVAQLSNIKDIICFSVNGRTIRFRGPYSLRSIESVVEWDNGYLVVEARYDHSDEAIEDYIDMTPILEMLYIDPVPFLSQIDKVEVSNA